MDSHVLKLPDRLRAVFLDHIRNGDDADKSLILCKEQRSLSTLRESFRFLFHLFRHIHMTSDKVHVSTVDRISV